MSQNPFDAFSKEFLSELLSPFGKVERSFEVPGESKYIDLLFLPTDDIQPKEEGVLKQVISTPSILEVYSGSPTVDELSTCLLKLLWLREDITRKAKSDKRKPKNYRPRRNICGYEFLAVIKLRQRRSRSSFVFLTGALDDSTKPVKPRSVSFLLINWITYRKPSLISRFPHTSIAGSTVNPVDK